MEIFSIDELKKFVDVRTETMQLNLENYIEKNNQEDREKLLKANFVFIKDKILEIKKSKQKTTSRVTC